MYARCTNSGPEPVLLVLSVCDGEIILEKGEILSEKRQPCCSSRVSMTS
jgi:hypothetical protein